MAYLGQTIETDENGYSLVVDVYKCPCGDPDASTCAPCDSGDYYGPFLPEGPQLQKAGFPWWVLLLGVVVLASQKRRKH